MHSHGCPGKLLPSDSFLMRRESGAWLQTGVLSKYDASYKIDKEEMRRVESVEKIFERAELPSPLIVIEI